MQAWGEVWGIGAGCQCGVLAWSASAGAGTRCRCRYRHGGVGAGAGRSGRAGLPSATALPAPHSLPGTFLSSLVPVVSALPWGCQGPVARGGGGIRAAAGQGQLRGDTRPPLSSRPSRGCLPGGGCMGFGMGWEQAELSVPSAIACPGWGWRVAPAVPGTAGVGDAVGGCWLAVPLSPPSPCAGGAALVPAAP